MRCCTIICYNLPLNNNPLIKNNSGGKHLFTINLGGGTITPLITKANDV